MNSAPTLSVDVTFDLVCPWCLIGKRHLDAALAQLRAEQPGLDVAVEWRSWPLFPDAPLEGLSYRAFYLARLGSAEAVAARQAQVQAAAREAGLALALTRIERFPNTLLAHRLVGFARQEAGAGGAAALIDKLFARYFLEGEDIGDPQVLRQAALECGIELPSQATDVPLRHDLPWLPPLHGDQEAPRRGVAGVPYFTFNGGQGISGAVPPSALLHVMRRALGQQAQGDCAGRVVSFGD